MKSGKPLLQLSKLKVGYFSDKPLFEAFSLDVYRGDFLSVVGSNGSGKTTLVRTTLGLLKPLGGQVRRAPELSFGYVPQKSKTSNHFPLSVEQVVMLGRTKRMGVLRRAGPEDHHIVMGAMEDVDIVSLRSRPIHALSGGQYQRMLIARALASEPTVLVLDEPTTGMDIVAEHNFMELIKDLKERLKLTVIMVTHDLTSAAQVSDQLVIINGTDKTVSCGAPMEVLTNKKLSTLFHRPLQVVNTEGHLSFIVGEEEKGASS